MHLIDLHSIRWRLPLTYAAIAFFAVLSLGVVLLAVLNDYYKDQERAYLQENAYTVSSLIRGMLQPRDKSINNVSDSALRNIAFLADIRIQLQDSVGDIIFDSGEPARMFVSMPTNNALWTSDDTVETNDWAGGTFTVIYPDTIDPDTRYEVLDLSIDPDALNTDSPLQIIPNKLAMTGSGGLVGDFTVKQIPTDSNTTLFDGNSVLSLGRSPYGYYLTDSTEHIINEQRSNQVATIHLFDENNSSMGLVKISEGPTYGGEILNSVAQSWMFAGSIAVTLAAIIGWIVSREVTTPLLSLTKTTTWMAKGDLSVRSNLVRDDEFGKLSMAFDEMAQRVEHTVLTLRRFVADAAHELHTPLTALRTNIELSAEEQDSVTLTHALQQVHRLEDLADALLDLSRIETMRDMPQQQVDIIGVVQKMSEGFASRAEQKEISIIDALPDTPITIRGNAQHLERMISNLLDNAVKFSYPGGTIWLKAHHRDKYIKLIVQNTGIGIPPSDIPYLFERFRRGSNTAGYPGSGLGLAIVKAIVEAHNGNVSATSKNDCTTITAKFPTT